MSPDSFVTYVPGRSGSCWGLASQQTSAHTTAIVTSELDAIAWAEGGTGAIVMPTTVNARTSRHSAANQTLRPRDIAAPGRNSARPPRRANASATMASGMLCHSPRPTLAEPAPAIGSSGRWTSTSSNQWENTAAETRSAARNLDAHKGVQAAYTASPATADHAMLAAKPCERGKTNSGW